MKPFLKWVLYAHPVAWVLSTLALIFILASLIPPLFLAIASFAYRIYTALTPKIEEGDYVEVKHDSYYGPGIGQVINMNRPAAYPHRPWRRIDVRLQVGTRSILGLYSRSELRKLDLAKDTNAARVAAWKLFSI